MLHLTVLLVSSPYPKNQGRLAVLQREMHLF